MKSRFACLLFLLALAPGCRAIAAVGAFVLDAAIESALREDDDWGPERRERCRRPYRPNPERGRHRR